MQIVFNKFDKDGSEEVDLNEFKEVLDKNLGDQLFVVNDSQKYNQNVANLLNKLKSEIQNHQLELEVLFKQFDTDGSMSLELNEFTKLVRGLYNNAEFQDISDLFNLIDKNSDSKLVITEFEKIVE